MMFGVEGMFDNLFDYQIVGFDPASGESKTSICIISQKMSRIEEDSVGEEMKKSAVDVEFEEIK